MKNILPTIDKDCVLPDGKFIHSRFMGHEIKVSNGRICFLILYSIVYTGYPLQKFRNHFYLTF
jgi:hypothetical protein